MCIAGSSFARATIRPRTQGRGRAKCTSDGRVGCATCGGTVAADFLLQLPSAQGRRALGTRRCSGNGWETRTRPEVDQWARRWARWATLGWPYLPARKHVCGSSLFCMGSRGRLGGAVPQTPWHRSLCCPPAGPECGPAPVPPTREQRRGMEVEAPTFKEIDHTDIALADG